MKMTTALGNIVLSQERGNIIIESDSESSYLRGVSRPIEYFENYYEYGIDIRVEDLDQEKKQTLGRGIWQQRMILGKNNVVDSLSTMFSKPFVRYSPSFFMDTSLYLLRRRRRRKILISIFQTNYTEVPVLMMHSWDSDKKAKVPSFDSCTTEFKHKFYRNENFYAEIVEDIVIKNGVEEWEYLQLNSTTKDSLSPRNEIKIADGGMMLRVINMIEQEGSQFSKARNNVQNDDYVLDHVWRSSTKGIADKKFPNLEDAKFMTFDHIRMRGNFHYIRNEEKDVHANSFHLHSDNGRDTFSGHHKWWALKRSSETRTPHVSLPLAFEFFKNGAENYTSNTGIDPEGRNFIGKLLLCHITIS